MFTGLTLLGYYTYYTYYKKSIYIRESVSFYVYTYIYGGVTVFSEKRSKRSKHCLKGSRMHLSAVTAFVAGCSKRSRFVANIGI